MKENNLPYINLIIDLIKDNNSSYKTSFKKNIHWGYWDKPKLSIINSEEFIEATERMTDFIIKISDINNGQTVLDIGCGFGGAIESLNKRYDNLVLYGLNNDSRQLEIAENIVKSDGTNTITFLLNDACRLPIESNSIDKIIAIESIFHLDNRSLFLQEVYRVLRRGGRIVFTDFVPVPQLIPVTDLISRQSINSGFFGEIYANYSEFDYTKIANEIGFKNQKIIDITENTLPTYSFLVSMAKELVFKVPEAVIPTSLLFVFSSLKMIKYLILSYDKE